MNPGDALEIAQREFLTVLRTPMLLALGAGYVALVTGIAWLTVADAYVALTLDLLTPVEVLVPVLAFAFGYRAILGDRESGELETLRTYPVSRLDYVGGVYIGRAVAVLAVVLSGLATSAALVPLSSGRELSFTASHATVDSPALYLRFVLLAAVFALVALAVAVLVSAAARSSRGGLALAVGAVIALVIGLDSAFATALTGGLLSGDSLTALLALSPNSAFRSLVFGLSVAPTGASVPAGPGTAVALVGLVGWWLLALGVSIVTVWRT
jgi:ABC-type transport system involved in multi-copper enzyme maturation permease subunit